MRPNCADVLIFPLIATAEFRERWPSLTLCERILQKSLCTQCPPHHQVLRERIGWSSRDGGCCVDEERVDYLALIEEVGPSEIAVSTADNCRRTCFVCS